MNISQADLLHWTLEWEFAPETVKQLLAVGPDPNQRAGPIDETPLHVAARRHRPWAIELLLAAGAEIDARTAGGSTAYSHARRRGFDGIAELLAGHGADVALTPADVLAVHLVRGEVDAARELIAAHPAMVPSWSAEYARILPDMAGREAVEAVTMLLDAGADIAARGLDGGTALHQAAWFGQPAVAKLLVERGAPLEMRGDDHDSTPLGWTAHGSRHCGGADQRSARYADVATVLLAAGASLADPRDPTGDPHGRWLLRDASPTVAAVLERHGAKR